MNLGKILANNRKLEKKRAWTSKLTGPAKEMYLFLEDTKKNIEEDIKRGGSVAPILIEEVLDYKKNIRMDAFWLVVDEFRIELLDLGLRPIFVEMTNNDLNRYGGFDHYLHIEPFN